MELKSKIKVNTLSRIIARLTAERRRVERRNARNNELLATTKAFTREERAVFESVERREHLRRTADVTHSIASLER